MTTQDPAARYASHSEHHRKGGSPTLAVLVVTMTLAGAFRVDAATFTVTNTNTSGSGSLAKAIADANLTALADTIEFDIAGSGPLTIGGTLPAITQPLTIDGYTQPQTSVNTLVSGATNAVLRIQIDAALATFGTGMIRVGAGPTTIRGVAIKEINTKGSGIEVAQGVSGVSIRGCFIGTKANGSGQLSNGTGILLRGTADVGTPFVPADRNLVSGNSAIGIDVRGPDSNIANNLIGTDAAGEPLFGNGIGIQVSTAAAIGNSIGGGERNVIAGNVEAGIRVLATASGSNAIERNSIHDNGGLGIDLAGDGVTANDEGDLDNGPNGLQNFPVLTFARVNGTTLTVEGYLNSEPGNYNVNFFQNGQPDPSGFGEGDEPVGGTVVTIEPGATTQFFSVPLAMPGAPTGTIFVSATAAGLGDDATSEFSRTIDAVDGGTELVVTNANDSGSGSLRQAILAANQNANINTIRFDLPLPALSLKSLGGFVLEQPVVIDGYTQSGASVNTLAVGTDAHLVIELNGKGAPAGASAFLVTSPGCVIRGLAIHTFPADGIVGDDADGLRVEGNFIGTNITGTADRGNGAGGIIVGGGAGVVIGGDAPAQRNLISGNQENGIVDTGPGSLIAGNIIGGDASGAGNLGNNLDGIFVTGSGTVIGSDQGDAGNVIRGNAQAGIAVTTGTGNQILGNGILENGGLGIDIEPFASPPVPENDIDDLDGGGNDGQNFPDIQEVNLLPGVVKVTGILDLPPTVVDATYTIRVFESEACDSSGHGEGAVFLGSADVVLSGDLGFNQVFNIGVAADVQEGAIITATATDVALGNTSEFSGCFELPTLENVCGDANGEEGITASDALTTLRAGVGSAECELCRCDVNDANGITASDALLVLRVAVGQDLELVCPACE